jgi:hypothetical protein
VPSLKKGTSDRNAQKPVDKQEREIKRRELDACIGLFALDSECLAEVEELAKARANRRGGDNGRREGSASLKEVVK